MAATESEMSSLIITSKRKKYFYWRVVFNLSPVVALVTTSLTKVKTTLSFTSAEMPYLLSAVYVMVAMVRM